MAAQNCVGTTRVEGTVVLCLFISGYVGVGYGNDKMIPQTQAGISDIYHKTVLFSNLFRFIFLTFLNNLTIINAEIIFRFI